MEEIQTQTSEVKEPDLEEPKSEMAEQIEENQEKDVGNSQPQEEKTETDTTLLELEEVLKGLKPDEVLKFQREISAEIGQNLFEGEIGELFKKYKPNLTKEEQVKNVADLLKGKKTATETAKSTEVENSTEKELLTTKIKFELYKKGVSEEFLEDATTIALTKIKSETELDKCGEIATRYAKLNQPVKSQTIPESQKTIPVGERDKDMTEGEKAVAFLKKLNPKGYK